MIKNAEIAMVHAANYALEYQDKKPNSDVEEIIKQFTKGADYLNIKDKFKLNSIAAINEIFKIKMLKENRGKTNKQLIQDFMKRIPEISMKLREGDD